MLVPKLLRSLLAILTILLTLLGLAAPAFALGEPREVPGWALKVQPPRVSADSAVLMDFETGRLLYAKDAFRRRAPASTTKVLTAIIALEQGKLNDKVKISKKAANTPGSAMHIREGEVYSLHDLVHGLLLRSGNDAAAAIAEHLAGSVEAFVGRMNEYALKLGAMDSHFANPHGLSAPSHYSTAFDLAVITRHALNNPQFAAIVSLRERPLTYEYLQRGVVLHNTNRLLLDLPDADGVKTGTTAAAGACLIASATRDEHKLISVVLHANNRWSDSRELLEWGYKHFDLYYLGRKGETVTTTRVPKGKWRNVSVILADDVAAVIPKGAVPPSMELDLAPDLRAPLKQGQPVGRAIILADGTEVSSANLTISRDLPRATWADTVVHQITEIIGWLSQL